MVLNPRHLTKLAILLCLVTVTSALLTVPGVYALGLENVVVWNWISSTEVRSTVAGDVDGDQSVEIVTGGSFNDGTHDNAQLCVWNGASLALENVQSWYWTDETVIRSVAIGDVDGDAQTEIVTGGRYHDGTRFVAQLCVWSGSTLALEQATTWYWTSDTGINSIAVGDVDGDQSVEIITGGQYHDGTRNVAQLCVWSGAALALENVTAWYWTSLTGVNSVAVDDVDGDQSVEIVTGGYYFDNIRLNAQLCIWSGSILALEQVTTWYWTQSTYINSIAIGDADGDSDAEIMTSGYYWDGARNNAQLCVWNGASLTMENVEAWYWTSDTVTDSVAISDVDADQSLEITTGGYHYDGTRFNAHLCVWSGSTLALEDVTTWYWVGGTFITSVAVGDIDGNSSVEIITGAYYEVSETRVAQLVVWGVIDGGLP